jgi:hypothetical protein
MNECDWKNVNKDLSFLVCGYMNQLEDTDNIMYELVKNYDELFPQDNVFILLNNLDQCKFIYFSFTHNHYANRSMTWNYHRKDKDKYYAFIDDWIKILQEKYYMHDRKKEIQALFKKYEAMRHNVSTKLMQCLKETSEISLLAL